MSRRSFNRPAILLCASMLAALLAVIAGAVRRFHPEWQPLSLIGVCFLVAIEAAFVYRVARLRHLTLGERLRYLVPELFVLATIMRLISTLSLPGADLGLAIRGWLYNPVSILDPLFVLYIVVGLAVGFLAHSTTNDMALIEPRPATEIDPHADEFERYSAFLAAERTAALARLASRFVVGGLLLLVALSVEVANVAQIGGPALPLSTLSIVAALIYLIAGFMLFSRARLAMLQARWQFEGAHVAPTVARRWSSGSLLLIVGVLLAAALLPRAYGMGLLDALRSVLGGVGYAIAMVGYLITWLFGMLLIIPAWLLSLVMISSDGGSPSAEPFTFPPPPQLIEQEPRLWPAFVFWLCMLLLVVQATRVVLQRHPRLGRGMRAWLARALRNLQYFWRGASSWVTLVIDTAREQLDRAAATSQGQPQRRAVRLDPRALVAHYYRAIVRIASEAGHPQRRGQTPTEYRSVLGAQRPELADDLTDLTEAYIRARYAPTPITTTDTRQVRGLWERLRRRLRGKKR